MATDIKQPVKKPGGLWEVKFKVREGDVKTTHVKTFLNKYNAEAFCQHLKIGLIKEYEDRGYQYAPKY